MESLLENIIGIIFIVCIFLFFFWKKIVDIFLFLFVPEKVEVEVLDAFYKKEISFRPQDTNDNLVPRLDSRKKILDFFFYIKVWDEKSCKNHDVEVPPYVYKDLKNKIQNSNSVIKFPCRKLSWMNELFF